MNHRLSIQRQCELLELPRPSYYYKPAGESQENLALMRQIDKQYMRTPFYGSRRIAAWFNHQGQSVNRKRIQRLMRLMGIEAIHPRPNTSRPHPGHKIYPYLLRNLEVNRVNQVWSTDITYIPMPRGFLYLVAVIDWYSRYVLSWELSNTLDADFCVEALKTALSKGTPEIFNTDQGSQFTSSKFIGTLTEHPNKIRISMDGRGRCFDNIFVERLWRTVKYEDVYIHSYETGLELRAGLSKYFNFYNTQRPHQALDYNMPALVFEEGLEQPD